ncbi:hypothetical protein DEU56DRAFT_502068 [Suillus clintonianus]|uniref:uncharacterized protein n=1 Tax=Suillus clintonianus TaxID=1904413 RepID=UPI001B878A36|nr:uncharacterized protein DEU56DRAFT_502068 [Suillus clintonianus]KAG2128985.1 hypothetical protein DEU56DRAFT_502068 [Suillus clintonianus]
MAQPSPPNALFISEILLAISYQLEDDKKALARLARCCRAFSAPALTVLWSSVQSFSPFIPLLPPSVKFLWDHCQFDEVTLDEFPCPPEEEWRVFDSYARRVRRLYSGWHFHQIVARIRSEITLFPLLRSLTLQLVEPLDIQVRLFSDSLRSLKISGPAYVHCNDDRVQMAIAHVSRDAPLVEYLHVEDFTYSVAQSSLPPLHFAHLRAVRISAFFDYSLLQSFCHILSQAPVTQLKLELPALPNKEWSISSPVFPALESLQIYGNPLSAEQFVSHLASKSVQELSIHHTKGPASAADYCQLLSCVADKYSNTLQTLSLTLSQSPTTNHLHDLSQAVLDAFYALAPSFKRLGTLHLSLPHNRYVHLAPELTFESPTWPFLKLLDFQAT